MSRTFLLIIFLVFMISGCSKKATVSTYSNVNVPIKNIQYVDLNIEGTELFNQRLRERIPIMFLGKEILVEDLNSPNILHIIENKLQSSTDIKDSEETREVKYVTQVYNSDSKQYESRITYVDRVYFKRCWIDKFELSSSVTTRYKRDTLVTETLKESCRTQRYNIFNRSVQNYDENGVYQELVIKLRDKIINYLVPYTVYYNIELEEDLDVEASKKDEKIFEHIIEQIDNGFTISSMIGKLEVLNEKYPNSYTIHFTIAILYEIFGEYDKALANYQKALEIQPEKKILERIQKVMVNKFNFEQIIKG